MEKIELLAPAGNKDALIAAVSAGCDAVYLGGKSFGARAFSQNFSNEEIKNAIEYCHIYGVKVYVTVNTLIYDNEVDDFIEYISFLHKSNVDAILLQDIGMLSLIRQTFPNLEVHSSTQMHIHNLDGALLMEKLGVKRVVLARETSIDEIKHIKENSNIDIEVFVHGALCISYSGQCLMSSLIGGRSGNRGCCAGSCRLPYDVIDLNNKKINKGDYPLSTKDLNTLSNIGQLIDIGVKSLKIEGRMKSPSYVYMVVKMYRNAIDSYYKNKKIDINDKDLNDLKKIFNRNYTKGFLFNTSNNDLINDYRPNHMGVKIGSVINYNNNYATIKLIDDLYIGSGLRVLGNNDVGINVNEFYINKKLVKEAHKGDTITIKVNDKIKIGSDVVITLDSNINKIIENKIKENNRKVLINGKFICKKDTPIELIVSDGVNEVNLIGSIPLSSINSPIKKENIIEKLNKISDSAYKFDSLNIELDDNLFIPIKEINELKREMIDKLNNKRLYKIPYERKNYHLEVPNFKQERLKTLLSDKYEKGYDTIYSEEDIPNSIYRFDRVIKEYKNVDKEVMIGEIGGLNKFKNCYTDFSLNVVNSYAVAFLHSMGVKRVTLSYELNYDQIKNLINIYHERYNAHPNLELIASAYPEVMVSKFKLNEYYNSKVSLKDKYGNIFKIKEKNNLMHIYFYKKIDIFDEKYYNIGINSMRINKDI